MPSAILETTFRTPTGVLVLRDCMPTGDGRADLVRTVRCSEGSVRVCHEWVVRFDYGLVRPWVTRQQAHGHEVILHSQDRCRHNVTASPCSAR